MCCIDIGGDGWNVHGKGITYRAFYFTDHRCVEKFMTGFRIDSHTIKWENILLQQLSNATKCEFHLHMHCV